jgi:hypothetical protein
VGSPDRQHGPAGDGWRAHRRHRTVMNYVSWLSL